MKKLILKKDVISNLSNNQLYSVKGGITATLDATCAKQGEGEYGMPCVWQATNEGTPKTDENPGATDAGAFCTIYPDTYTCPTGGASICECP